MDEKHRQINQTILAIHDEMRALEAKLVAVRATCEHPTRSVGIWQWGGPGRQFPARICDVCLSDPKHLEPSELEAFLALQEKQRSDMLRAHGGIK